MGGCIAGCGGGMARRRVPPGRAASRPWSGHCAGGECAFRAPYETCRTKSTFWTRLLVGALCVLNDPTAWLVSATGSVTESVVEDIGISRSNKLVAPLELWWPRAAYRAGCLSGPSPPCPAANGARHLCRSGHSPDRQRRYAYGADPTSLRMSACYSRANTRIFGGMATSCGALTSWKTSASHHPLLRGCRRRVTARRSHRRSG